ncbi:MAG: response regulator transcription factor [Treponema sp.]|nr:response regulator transcription factor [Treponema sp.]
MRVLVIDPGGTHTETERKAEGPLSVFISRAYGPEHAGAYDLLVLPVGLLLDQAVCPDPEVPRIAYGPAGLMADAFAEGCADYLRDPWDLEELEARALRFCIWKFSLGGNPYSYSAGRLTGKAGSKRLSEGERKALELLLPRLGRVVPRGAFLRAGGSCDRPGSRSLDMSICRLRSSLVHASGDPRAGSFLGAARNYGYRLDGKPCA